MSVVAKYRFNDDDVGGNNLLSLAMEVLAIGGIVWVGLFLMPMYFGRGAQHNDEEMNFLLDFYNHPGKYYPFISAVALGSAAFYAVRQLRPLKIVAMDVYNDSIDFVLTNRLHRKVINKNISLANVVIQTKEIDAGIVSYIRFYNKLKFLGTATFSETSHRYEMELVFLQKIKEMGVAEKQAKPTKRSTPHI